MAVPAAAVVAKIAAAVLTNEKTRKALGWIIAAILSPVILIIVVICSLLSGTSQHNNMALELAFHGGVISGNAPEEYRGHIMDMRRSFELIDNATATVNAQIEDVGTLDTVRIKAIFYSLFFAADQPSARAIPGFVDCFVTYEQRTRTVTKTDADGNEYEDEETYTVAIPIKSLSVIYQNVAAAMDVEITFEDKANAAEIYHRILYGGPAPTYDTEFDDWLNGLPLSDVPFIGADGFCAPTGEGWRSAVTSEFGWRRDPFTGQQKYHGGIDLAYAEGTPIRAALPGTVMLVRYATSGYGYHIMIDHGGKFVTLYAHCSKILVSEGQKVEAGDVIGTVGTTGRSTGNHLHFEVINAGEKQNPRSYLP